MPDTHCPSWCSANHARNWEAVAEDIGQGDGPADLAGALLTWRPMHSRPLVTIGLGGNVVTVEQIGEGLLYLTGGGELTGDQALDLAAALTEAVRTLGASS